MCYGVNASLAAQPIIHVSVRVPARAAHSFPARNCLDMDRRPHRMVDKRPARENPEQLCVNEKVDPRPQPRRQPMTRAFQRGRPTQARSPAAEIEDAVGA